MDWLSFLGVIFAFVAVLGGNFMEGGHIGSLFNGPAALIVIGGTFAAIMIQTSFDVLKQAFKMFLWVFSPPYSELEDGINKIVGWSVRARKDGLLGLEAISDKEMEPFAKKGLMLLVDGSEPETIRSVLEVDLTTKEEFGFDGAKVFDSMGGYSPTIGIIGAVMGLIHVMSNLADPASLGAGIATAFVATIYGVAFANLLLFPVANKLKALVKRQSQYREMIIEGLVSISEGENPRSIELKLKGFLN
jgi:chemotaxis protein MotA